MGQRHTSASGRSHAVGHSAEGDAELSRVCCIQRSLGSAAGHADRCGRFAALQSLQVEYPGLIHSMFQGLWAAVWSPMS